MSITVDPRAGSEKLYAPLRKMHGTKVQMERMDFADVAFIGKGEEGTPVPVGIEYKKIGDLLQCMQDDRFTRHQLPGLRDCYEDIWLIIEGEWDADKRGLLNVRRGRRMGLLPGRGRRQMTYSRLAKFLISLEIRGGIRWVHTKTLRETVGFVSALYEWWTAAHLEHHKSHVQASLKRRFTDATGLLPAHDAVKMLAQIEGIGRSKAEAILEHYGSFDTAYTALKHGWGDIPGVGPALRMRIRAAMSHKFRR